jgi:hypothetical protein
MSSLKTYVYLMFMLLMGLQQPIKGFSVTSTMPVSTTHLTALYTHLIDAIKNHPYLSGCLVTVGFILYRIIKFNREKEIHEKVNESDSPDLQAREKILSSYLSKMNVDPLITAKKLAELTPLAYPDELRYLVELAEHFQQQKDVQNNSQEPYRISPESFLDALEKNRANKTKNIVDQQIQQQDVHVHHMRKSIQELETLNFFIDYSAEDIIDSVKHIPNFDVGEILFKTAISMSKNGNMHRDRESTDITQFLTQAIAEVDLSWENRKKREFARDCCIMYNLPTLPPTVTFYNKQPEEVIAFIKECALRKQNPRPHQLLLTWPQ